MGGDYRQDPCVRKDQLLRKVGSVRLTETRATPC